MLQMHGYPILVLLKFWPFALFTTLFDIFMLRLSVCKTYYIELCPYFLLIVVFLLIFSGSWNSRNSLLFQFSFISPKEVLATTRRSSNEYESTHTLLLRDFYKHFQNPSNVRFLSNAKGKTILQAHPKSVHG